MQRAHRHWYVGNARYEQVAYTLFEQSCPQRRVAGIMLLVQSRYGQDED